MKGGRKYKDILEYLSCQEDVKLVNGIELVVVLTQIGYISDYPHGLHLTA